MASGYGSLGLPIRDAPMRPFSYNIQECPMLPRLSVLTLLLLIPSISLAHGGGLDSSGCHKNRKTGDYHCHRAPAQAPRSAPEEQEPRNRFAPQSPKGFSCAGKRTCGQMTSCAEAHFYLTECGMHRLDGDNDGTPCESLC